MCTLSTVPVFWDVIDIILHTVMKNTTNIWIMWHVVTIRMKESKSVIKKLAIPTMSSAQRPASSIVSIATFASIPTASTPHNGQNWLTHRYKPTKEITHKQLGRSVGGGGMVLGTNPWPNLTSRNITAALKVEDNLCIATNRYWAWSKQWK